MCLIVKLYFPKGVDVPVMVQEEISNKASILKIIVIAENIVISGNLLFNH